MWVMRVLRGDVGNVHALDVLQMLQDLFRTLMDNDLRIAPNVVLRCVGSKELHRGLAVR